MIKLTEEERSTKRAETIRMYHQICHRGYSVDALIEGHEPAPPVGDELLTSYINLIDAWVKLSVGGIRPAEDDDDCTPAGAMSSMCTAISLLHKHMCDQKLGPFAKFPDYTQPLE